MRVRHLFATAAGGALVVLAVTVAAEAIPPVLPGVLAPSTATSGAHDPQTAATAGPDEWLQRGLAVDAGGMDPGLDAALRRATDDAARDGVDLFVSSGYRSAAEQAATLEREVAERGALDEALHWVFLPEDSMHVRGLAIDVSGPGADWLERHGARFGLCKTLAWEWWHFEWRARWEAAGSCPAPAASPAEAPAP